MFDPSAIVTIAPGRLHALCNAYALDRPVSTHPADLDGYASLNCYLLTDGDEALLVDTGYTAHQEAIIGELDHLLAPETTLSVLPLRYGEFGSLCNVRSIAEHRPVTTLYGQVFGPAHDWLDFRPDLDDPKTEEGGRLRDIESRPLGSNGKIPVGATSERAVELMTAPIRLLPLPWGYDRETRTLFTADLFGWVTRDRAQGPWIVSETDPDTTTRDTVLHYLAANRYWWVPAARTERLRGELASLFERYEVETIAPGYGCILHGSEVVQRHVKLLDEALAHAAELPSIGLAVCEWSIRSAA